MSGRRPCGPSGIERPLAIDLFTGLHGWSEGLVAEGFRVVGFDIENMCEQFGMPRPDHVQLVLQDVLTIHGRQFKDAALIVASPPCQAYSYMAMPWSKAKQIQREYEDGTRDVKQLTALFDACFRIQREACEAAGWHIPLVVENVRGAQKWVGRSRWNFGSFHLWGDVPALMPMAKAIKGHGGSWFNIGSPGQTVTNQNPVHRLAAEGMKVPTMGAGWYPTGHPKHRPGLAFNGHAERNTRRTAPGSGARFTSREDGGIKYDGPAFGAGVPYSQRATNGPHRHGSKSHARKAVSALIAKIPMPLARWIARAWHPERAA